MKKLVTGILMTAMVVSLAACGGNKENNQNANNTINTDVNQETGNTTPSAAPTPEVQDTAVIVPDVAQDTLGYKLWETFVALREANPVATTEELTGQIMSSEIGMAAIQFGMMMPVEQGSYLMGINGGESLSFKAATQFAPGMMGVAFLGYMFELEDAAAAPEFVKYLKENCDPSWNICTTAEMVTAGALENVVFFVMSPSAVPGGEAVITYPEIDSEANADAIWCAFEDAMNFNPSANAEDVAAELTMGISIDPLGTPVVTEAVAGKLEGFKNDVEGFALGQCIKAEGNDSFVAYVFQLDKGMDAANWASYYVGGADAEQVFWGSYNEMILVLMNTDVK